MTDTFSQIYLFIDPFFIWFYRLTPVPIANYYIGTFCLSMVAVVIGELTVSLALKANASYLGRLADDMNLKEKMAAQAYQNGDKEGYKALNKSATDAWGKRFFAMMGHSAAILWPIPFALGWMQTRFSHVEFLIAFPFSLMTDTVGYTFSFFPIYILDRIVFGRIRPFLPYFSAVHKELMKK